MLVSVLPVEAVNASNKKGRATQPEPNFNLLFPGEPVALDVEFQEYFVAGGDKWGHRVGRAAIVNTKGETILDVYATYPKKDHIKKKMPPSKFGVTWKDLLYENGALPAWQVEKNMAKIMEGRKVVVHGGRLDTECLFFEGEAWLKCAGVIDTQDLYYGHNGKQQPGLADLTPYYLKESIQAIEHSPVEDAKATMSLYLLKRPYDREKEYADYKATLAPPAETLVQVGKKWVLTAAAYAPPDLGRDYTYVGKDNNTRRRSG